MRHIRTVLAAAALSAAANAPVLADITTDCFGEDVERRISGCTALIERSGRNSPDLSFAYAMRALAYSMKREYSRAIADYDVAIKINPNYAVALNNRAWAYFRWGRAQQGLPDVERSLKLNPTSPHALDTRAHIRQALGQTQAALADYDGAIWFGGSQFVRLYQCGLTEQGLYKGEIDGVWRPELREALESCVGDKACDPLPSDEQCRAATS
jgi:tetratricopeptide (TPR) repeat protein